MKIVTKKPLLVGTAILTWVQFRYVERHVHYG